MPTDISTLLGSLERPASVTGSARAKPATSDESGVSRASRAVFLGDQSEQKPAREEVEQVAQELNQLVHDLQRKLQFSVDGESGDTILKVIDRETEELVRQIPLEEVVELRKHLAEVSGVIFNDSA